MHSVERGELQTQLFRIGMWWRIFYGLGKLLFGLFLLQYIGLSINEVVQHVFLHELVEDPQDLAMSMVVGFFDTHMYVVTYFLASYFIFWGVVDMFLSVNLLRDRIWAFPISLVLIVLFICYEIVRFFHTHSIVLLGIIFIDVILVYLIYEEYAKLKRRMEQKADLV